MKNILFTLLFLLISQFAKAVTITASRNPVCVGECFALTADVSGGTWSSSTTGIIDTCSSVSGSSIGVSAGTCIITYTLGTGTYTTITVTVNATPAPITGVTTICAGSSTTLSDVIGGGTWSSSNTSVAPIVSSLGLCTGLSYGTTIITYITPTGCYTTTMVTVTPAPGAIIGSSTVCVGNTITLSNTVTGGVWSSSNVTVVSAGSATGILTGISAGTAVVTYSLGGTCRAIKMITVLASPGSISGYTTICFFTTTTLTNSVVGGNWSSSNTTVATIGAISGLANAVGVGSSIITYTLPNTCYTTTTFNVLPAIAAIVGPNSLCVGTSVTETDIVSGAFWFSSNTSVDTVGSLTGIVTGVSSGTALISYGVLSGACLWTKNIAVLSTPSAISGFANICIGTSSTLTNSVSGGSWSSSNTSVATIGSTSGVVTSVSIGSTIITYAITGSCYSTVEFNVVPTPTPIVGPTSVCVGAAISETDAIAGGSWFSSSGAAIVNSVSGLVTGISSGTTTITYALGTGCMVTKIITVLPSPSTISGYTTICNGSTTTLTNAASGGTWSSSNTAIATIGTSSGLVTSLAVGSTIITYTLPGLCYTTTTLTVVMAPPPISGPNSLCTGATITEVCGVGGAFTSSNAAVATIGISSGVMAGISPGTTIITYAIGTGCMVTKVIRVWLSPPPISGLALVCTGAGIVLTDGVSGGTWSSSNISVAIVGSTSGIVSGLALGTVTITYTSTGSCFATKVINVLPTPAPITGPNSVCTGSTVIESDVTLGGTWSIDNLSILNFGTGGFIGVSPGVATITYTLGFGCIAT